MTSNSSGVKFLVITNIFVVVAFLVSLWFNLNKPKTAFVKSQKVIEQYMGMKEAQQAYQKKLSDWQLKLDTMQAHIKSEEQSIEENKSLSGKERSEKEASINLEKENFLSYKKKLEEDAQREGQSLTQGTLNQINSYIENYAKEHNYEIVHGATMSGNILYASNSIDITDEIIAGLNESYKK